jgi:glycosyltransferase involved in cell wall biosynthesis
VVVGTVARLFPNKGYEQLIPAMADAARRCPNLRFVWVGDGAQAEPYRLQLTQLGLIGRVVMTGLVPPQDVPSLIAGMDVIVHASQWEGLPRVAVQALLMAKPVISFDIDGAPEVVIPGRTGILVPLNDAIALAAAIEELARDADRRATFGRNGRALCLERFDHNTMVDALERLYKQLAEARAHA